MLSKIYLSDHLQFIQQIIEHILFQVESVEYLNRCPTPKFTQLDTLQASYVSSAGCEKFKDL